MDYVKRIARHGWGRSIAGIVVVSLFSGSAVWADFFQSPINANNARLEEYVNPTNPGLTVIWSYPPLSSSFPGGCQSLELPSIADGQAGDASEGQRSRFFALVMLAKAANRQIVVTYDNARAPNCIMQGFWADPW